LLGDEMKMTEAETAFGEIKLYQFCLYCVIPLLFISRNDTAILHTNDRNLKYTTLTPGRFACVPA
jgi:hypothetical protein